MIDPQKIGKVYCSPRTRARQTHQLAFRDVKALGEESGKFAVEERLREWTYGDYEGLFTKEIRELRRSRGLDQERAWDIWVDGCEGGE